MATLSDSLHDSHAPNEVDWLHQLIGDWQLLADLSFADLALLVRRGPNQWETVAHVRPNTGEMIFVDDVVGRILEGADFPTLAQAFRTGRIVRSPAPVLRGGTRVYEEAIPVVFEGRSIAVVTRHTSAVSQRTPSLLEDTYRSLGDDIAAMISTGEFPGGGAATGIRRGAPRVGDGVIHLDTDGIVRYASPNAMSALHRLGHHETIVGENLARIVADIAQRSDSPVDESLALVVTGRAAWRSEVVSLGATVTMRALPLTRRGQRTGAIVLVREITELRRRERELMTREATIREIHHRVKNNLQTVAALLRLQARRLPPSEAREALDEAVRRVGTIALVHETLSQGFHETVAFDDIAVQGLQAIADVASGEHGVDATVTGTFGRMRAEDATALAMIMSELIQNAAEHGLAQRRGRIILTADRSDDALTVTVTDDGEGLPAGFRPGADGLGTQIVMSFVEDLRGTIVWERAEPRGTTVRLRLRLRPLDAA